MAADSSALSDLKLDNFVQTFEGHVPAGTFVNSMLPDGQEIPHLFRPLQLRSKQKLTLKNRAIVSPMCQYSAKDGFPNPWHLAHLGSFAIHGAGTIMVEASGVTPEGRITPQDLGIWSDAHARAHGDIVASLKRISDKITVGVQIAHAGRKASTWSPFYRGPRQHKARITNEDEGAGGYPDDVVGPSAVAYGPNWIVPKELSKEGIQRIKQAFVDAAQRAYEIAGYDFVELHFAHGYLGHSFLSPISNKRTDEYGGSFENRTRILFEMIREIKQRWPDRSLWVRISATDYAEHLESEGQETWNLQSSIKLAQLLEKEDIDFLDVSAGGLTPEQRITPGPGYQLEFAKEIRKALPIAQSNSPTSEPRKSAADGTTPEVASHLVVGAVGLMDGGAEKIPGDLAEKAIKEGDADAILLARGFLGNPKWVIEASERLTGGIKAGGSPQYHRSHEYKAPKPQNHN
ncbi:hypothetical protein OC846_003597 [Tilletia horrida]|uniref:NADH:flavin oxidoreductase/NADH oxidase N-terminal domain-containing protein n=1 Tax=Tilletia horrida TaxID=155126 RepID=A0AAN6GNT9_9BASI|nr:hypothetical protein OC846_003597 [Tilletia horrida]KAK0550892.1 hypothetical protein OC845_002455 [Tilletia horrida]KAK0565732.1 hypothetical protein OC861_003602 [Tilletia horrida]